MSVEFLIGPSGAGKSTYLEEKIIQLSMSDPTRKYLLIVPDQFNMQTQLDLIEKHPLHAFSNIEVLSFSRLSHRILEEVGGEDIPVLDDTGKNLIIRHVAGSIKDRLSCFGERIDKTGFISEVKSALSEFMQYGYSPDMVLELARKVRNRGLLSRKIADLALIFEEFVKYKADHFLTREETLGLVSESLHNSEMIRNSYIFFDGFTGFTPIQENVIAGLISCAQSVVFSFTVGEEADPHAASTEEELFYLPIRAMSRLRKLAGDCGIEVREDMILPARRSPNMLGHIEKHMFRYPHKSSELSDGSLRIYKAADIREEVRDTFYRIRELISREGLRFSDIAIVTGDMSSYADEIRKCARLFGVPVYLDYSRNIMSTSFAEFIISAYDVLKSNYTTESVIRHLRTGLGPLDMEETDELENFLLRCGIRGKSSYEHAWTVGTAQDKEESDEARQERERRFIHINQIREKVLNHFESLHNKKQTHVRNLYDFLEKAGIYDKLKVMSTRFSENGDVSSEIEYSQIYDKVMELLDQIESLCGDELKDTGEFVGVLEAGLSEIKVGVIPQERDQVMVGDIIRTRLMNIKALFLLGVNDCNIPGSMGSGGIISDVDREYLRGIDGAELAPSPREQMFTQRMYLYMNMTKPSEHLYMSYVITDAGGKDMQPSYLIGTMGRMFPKAEIELTSADHRVKDSVMPVSSSRIRVECAAMLRRYLDGSLKEEEIGLLTALYKTISAREDEECLSRIIDASSMHYEDVPLPEDLARRIYGDVMKASVSRLEKFCSCAYAHFLNYGLIIRERSEYSFERRDLGDVYHRALEVFSVRLKQEGLSWEGLGEEEAEAWVDEIVEDIAKSYSDTILISSHRNIALSDRIRRVIKRSVDTIRYQVTQGEFIPSFFEKSFSDERTALVGDGGKRNYRLVGKIDRMDICSHEDNRYLRIVDYKSGNKDLELTGMYYGFMLQLPVYLEQAVKQNRGYEPAGMLYYHIDDPLINVKSEFNKGQARSEIVKALKMKGLVSCDEDALLLMDKKLAPGIASDIVPVTMKKDMTPDFRSKAVPKDTLELICRFALNKADETVGRILAGDISNIPSAFGKNKLPCEYCEYAEVCRVGSGIDGYGYRRYDALQDQDVLERMSEPDLGARDGR